VSSLRSAALMVLLVVGLVSNATARELLGEGAITWAWDEPPLQPEEEVAEAAARWVAFGEHTEWFQCDASAPRPTVRLMAPPARGAFTRPGASQMLFQYVFDPCDEPWRTTYPRRAVIVEEGVAVRVLEDRSVGYYETLSSYEVVDLDGDGVHELVRRYAGMHHARVSIATVGDTALRQLASFLTFEDDCYVDPVHGGAAWGATVTYQPGDGAWPAFALEFEVFDCYVSVPEALQDAWEQRFEDALARAAGEPVASAMAVLALAWEGSPAAQRAAARMYEEGTVVPRDLELAAWWWARAEAGDGRR